ncbi:MAG: 2-C-methyl-D-erythritol 2,4-cyclodiphosphate synthase, partial [Lachnospiraceae bacterium]|nr:2-C-methyl-D-erythritol 2,4-cyclodiphosphate synthase [Lachnospiraceae bacterium]
ISSLDLLSHVGGMLSEEGYVVGNIDATIIAQAPKMRPYIDEMRKNIADTLSIDMDQVNVKATTEEGLGFTGSGEGIASSAVCLLENVMDYSKLSAVYGSAGGCPGCSGCSNRE